MLNQNNNNQQNQKRNPYSFNARQGKFAQAHLLLANQMQKEFNGRYIKYEMDHKKLGLCKNFILHGLCNENSCPYSHNTFQDLIDEANSLQNTQFQLIDNSQQINGQQQNIQQNNQQNNQIQNQAQQQGQNQFNSNNINGNNQMNDNE